MDVTFATGNKSNPLFVVYRSNDMTGIDLLEVGHFDEMNKGFEQLIYSLKKVAAESQEAESITPASYIDHKKKGKRGF